MAAGTKTTPKTRPTWRPGRAGQVSLLRSAGATAADLRSLLLLRKRLKKQVHSCRVRIRNNLVAQYFPELDLFWNNAEAENLAIVRGYLDPAVSAVDL